MLLRRVQIENFRGLRAIDLSIDETTLLIGENASGKTSVLGALQVMLAPIGDDPMAPLTPDDAHRAVGVADDGPAPIRITLTFVESNESRWAPELAAPLGAVTKRTADDRSLIALELEADAGAHSADGAMRHAWRFVDPADGSAVGATAEQVNALRRCAPLAMLDPGDRPAMMRADGSTDQVTDLYERITRHRAQLSRDDLRAAADLASDVAEHMLAAIGDRETPARRWLEETAALREIVAGGDDGRLGALLLGAGSRILSLLALAGAAQRERKHDGHATPLLCVDTPEARLHPLSLAPLWNILELLPGQKIVTTNSGDLLAAAPLDALRSLARTAAGVRVGAITPGSLDDEARRRIAYHIRARRGGALFARCWLLVEGETEFWLLPELARTMGYDFAVEGVAVVEFAQCGVPPLIHVARDLGIAWRLLADNDRSGRSYADAARRSMGPRAEEDAIVMLDAGDIEEAFWDAGYAEVYRAAAYGGSTQARAHEKRRTVIDMAIRATSKPHLALRVLEEASRPGASPPPAPITALIESAVASARAGAG